MGRCRVVACAPDDPAPTDITTPTDVTHATGSEDDEAQVPLRGANRLDRWLGDGHYLDWACEPEPQEARAGSAHFGNRICSNDAMSAAGAGEYPVGSASVKELYDEDLAEIVGYAVSLHDRPGTTGDTWYWYEVASGHVYADGHGDEGAARSICAGCHASAGSDPEVGGHDFVFVQVE